jgi:hypothetical protein
MGSGCRYCRIVGDACAGVAGRVRRISDGRGRLRLGRRGEELQAGEGVEAEEAVDLFVRLEDEA